MNSINNARNNAVSDVIDSFGITKDTSNNRLSDEFNIQMNFWKNLVAGAAVDNDNDLLDRSYEAIKGVMLLPWNSEQLSKWNSLLSHIK
jgi:capsule polysaccharide export protein KpsC/LpsZ